MKNNKKKIVIVGAGPGGLAISMLLANCGLDVTVLEKRNQVGGRTGQIKQDGFTFDIGPTFFLYPPVIENIFKRCGFDFWAEVPMKKLDPMYRLVFENRGYLDAKANIGEMMEEIARIAPNDAPALQRYMDENRQKLEHFKPVLESAFESVKDFMRPEVMKSVFMLRPQLSIDGDLRRYFADDRVRQAFSFQAKYLGMSPFNCPSLFTILAFLEYEYGVYHPIGGCGAVMDKMAELATRMGVKIKLSEGVESIDFDGKRARSAITAKGRYECDSMVINADFAQTMRTLVPNRIRRKWTDKSIEKKKYSCSTYMMYLGIKGRYDDLPHHTIFLSEDLHGNIDQIQHRKVLPENPSFYVQNASINDSSLAPKDMSTLYVLVPVANLEGETEWNAETEASFREFALKRLEAIGLTDLRERIVTEKIMTPQRWHDELDVYNGATFNLSHTLTQMLTFRPHNRFEDLDGVYLVGGGTHPGSGLPVIFESARISADLMAQDLGVSLEKVEREDDVSTAGDLQLERAS